MKTYRKSALSLTATFVTGMALTLAAQTANGQIVEAFDTATVPPTGWVVDNNSVAGGIGSWFNGNPAAFPAHAGASYIGVNFQSTTGTNTISNWLISPQTTLNNGGTISFWTRTPTGSIWGDRLQVRISTARGSVNVGTSPTDVGDFTTLLLDINPTYATGAATPGAYPEVWTEFTATISGLARPTQGRIAFRYFVENGGPSGANSNYIGIDTFAYTNTAPCDADTNLDGQVNVTDLLAVISAWGACTTPPCSADTNDDGQINVTDLLAVIGAWGAC